MKASAFWCESLSLLKPDVYRFSPTLVYATSDTRISAPIALYLTGLTTSCFKYPNKTDRSQLSFWAACITNTPNYKWGKKIPPHPPFFSNKLSIKQSLLAVWGKNPHFFLVGKIKYITISIYFILQVINYDKNNNFCLILLSRKIFLSCLCMLSAQRLLLHLCRITNNDNCQETDNVPVRWLWLVDIHSGIGRSVLTTHPALHKTSSEIKNSCIGYKKNRQRH